jgi:chemotaxis protein CheX
MSHSPVDLLSVFQQAIASTLKEMTDLEILEIASWDPKAALASSIEVAGIIGLNLPGTKGALSLQFSKEILSRMASRIGTQNANQFAEDLTCAVLRSAEAQFQSLGQSVQCSLPNLLSGDSLEALGNRQSKNWVGAEISVKEGRFWVLLETDPQESEAPVPGREYGSPKNWTAEALLEFVRAVRKTLEVQFSTRIEIGAPFKKTEDAFTFDVGSMIGVTDGNFSGYFGMYYQKSTFLGLMNILLGADFTELSEDIQDGASEITNICFGVAKQVLNDQGHSIQMALPYLIRGTGITSAGSSAQRTAIAVPLSTPYGSFWIEFGYRGT